jgi:hypothetical protein
MNTPFAQPKMSNAKAQISNKIQSSNVKNIWAFGF